MSITTVGYSTSAYGSVMYAVYGRGNEYKQNLEHGTDRAVVCRVDAPDVFAFARMAQERAVVHNRKNQVASLIQSWPPGAIDATDPEALQEANDAGYELAKRLWPKTPVLVITHTDAKGGHVHNHLYVINHDPETGQRLSKTHHNIVAPVNDAVMQDFGYKALAPVKEKRKERSLPWHERRAKLDAREKLFEVSIGDALEYAAEGAESLTEFVELYESQPSYGTEKSHRMITPIYFDEGSEYIIDFRVYDENHLDLTKTGKPTKSHKAIDWYSHDFGLNNLEMRFAGNRQRREDREREERDRQARESGELADQQREKTRVEAQLEEGCRQMRMRMMRAVGLDPSALDEISPNEHQNTQERPLESQPVASEGKGQQEVERPAEARTKPKTVLNEAVSHPRLENPAKAPAAPESVSVPPEETEARPMFSSSLSDTIAGRVTEFNQKTDEESARRKTRVRRRIEQTAETERQHRDDGPDFEF